MFEFIARHRTGLTFIVLVLGFLSMIAAQVPAPDHPSLLAWVLYGIVSPVQQGFAAVANGVNGLLAQYVTLHNVQAENSRLREDLDRALVENQGLRETLALVHGEQKLREFHSLYSATYNQEAIEAMVIGAGTSQEEETILVDKGTLDGVAIDMGVISPSGVVGKVIRCGPNSSLVQLLTDPSFAMAARIQDTRVRGVVHGDGGVTCDLLYIRDTDPIAVGQRVVSSGMEKIFPRGILIGHVILVRAGEPPLREVELAPSAELRSLEWVLIIKWQPEISDQE